MARFDPLLDDLLQLALVPLGLREIPVPEWARLREVEVRGEPLRLTSRCWAGGRVARARLSRIVSPSAFEAFNLLIVPRPETGAPIFGAEFLVVAGRAHLAVVDLQDLLKDDGAWQRRWIDPLAATAAPFLACSTPRDEMPEWTRAFFSRLAFHRKPVGDELPTCEAAFRAYLSHYFEALSSATPLRDDADVDRMRAAHRAYNEDHVANEPAVRTLGRLFGDAWAVRYTREFLFGEPSADTRGASR